MKLSDNSRKLILDFEVGGGEAYYNKYLSRPSWPGEASGVTIGIGYDCGYNSRETILQDWAGLESASRLAATAGKIRSSAKALIPKLRDIQVPWDLALEVYEEDTVPKFWELTRRAYPGFDDLHPDAQGVLLSLTFNRGAAMSGDRRLEMRSIRALVPRKDYEGMAKQLRDMKRIWPNTAGLRRRRDAEAALMQRCK
jgi:hypothetical protein